MIERRWIKSSADDARWLVFLLGKHTKKKERIIIIIKKEKG
jgi:hypothetical protein